MKVIKTDIKDVLLFEIDKYLDSRGMFYESFNYKKYEPYLNNVQFIQDNESTSKYGVLRGLHYQKKPYEQAKLIRVVKGKIQDVVVDIRKESPTYKKHISIELSDENNYQLFVPHGFAHGFLVLSTEAIVSYKVDSYYNKELDSGYRYDDPSFNINWSIKNSIILSDKDKKLPFL